jgi:hypothetical protein
MSEKLYDKLTSYYVDKTALVPFFLLMWVAMVVSSYLMYVDYTTSRMGYEAFPSAKVNQLEIFAVAFLPQLIQMVTGYILVGLIAVKADDDADLRLTLIAGILWFSAFFIDVGTDVYYRLDGSSDPFEIGVNILVTIVAFTFGSEMLWVFSLGMLRRIQKPGFAATAEFVKDLVESVLTIISSVMDGLLKGIGAIAGVMGGMFVKKKASKPSQQQKPPQQTQNQQQSSGTRFK